MVEFELIDPRALKPHPSNVRKHPEEQIRALAAGFREFGFQGVVVIDEGGVILAGHGRSRAAVQAGLESVPCKRVLGWSDAKKRAFAIADNRVALSAEWDDELLRLELKDLLSGGEVDMQLLGFGDKELNEMIATAAEDGAVDGVGWTEDDAAPPTPEAGQVVAQLGDVWVLGSHRVMCGDSTSVDDMRKLAVQEVGLWLTDPPYNVAYEGGTADALKIMNDSMSDEKFRAFLRAAYAAADAVMRPGAAFYVWHADKEGYNFRGAARDVGWPVRQCLVWRKSSLVLGRQDYHSQHEPCLYGWKPGAAHEFFGGRKQTTVRDLADAMPLVRLPDGRWQIAVGGRPLVLAADALVEFPDTTVIDEAKPNRNGEHPTMKPVALFERQMLNSSKIGDRVLDSFGGSGTTVIAAQKTGRHARVMELDPRYVDVIVRRWQDYAAQEAVLEDGGLTFAEVADRRGVTAAPA